MNYHFHIGQRARVVKSTVHPELLGVTVIITSDLIDVPVQSGTGITVQRSHLVEFESLPNMTGRWAAPPEALEPFRDCEPGRWSDVAAVTGYRPPSQVAQH